jgi:hypothetical protein
MAMVWCDRTTRSSDVGCAHIRFLSWKTI